MRSYLPAVSGRGFGFERLTPSRITAIYVAFGLSLLFVSDVLLPAWISDPGLLWRLQGLKGAVEVFLTGGVIYVLVDRMERRLHESERRYRNLIETSPAPINLFDEDGTTVWGNDAVLELLGLEDRADLVGRSIFEFIHPDDRGTAEDELRRVIREGRTTGPTSMRLRRDDGEVRHIRVSTAPGRFRDARVGQAVVIDVTELREIEDELREERDFIRDTLDELRDVFFVVGPDGGLERWNERLSRVTGYDDDELASMTATDLVPPEDERRVSEAVGSALETGESFVEVDLVTKDGDERRYEIKGARLDGGDEDPRGIVGIGRDVTERKRMERELRENERRYRTLVEMSPDPILVHVDGEIVYANDATVDLVEGDRHEELVGTPLGRYLHPEESEEVAETAGRVQRGEVAPTRYERPIVTSEGDTRYVETTSRPIAYEGEPAVLTILKDVTDRHRYEEMLTTLHDRTRAMTRAGGREEIAEIAVETADELLDSEGSLFYEFDGTNELVPIARSDRAGEGSATGKKEGPLWEVFADGEERFVDDLPDEDGRYDGPFRSALVLPVGNHGVLVAGTADGGPLTTIQREVAHLIKENSEAAFDRAERERVLRERDEQLQRQNETLEQLNRLNEISREINRTLIRSPTRAEIGESVCEQISAAHRYSFAWIGTRDPVDGHVVPQYWDGMDPEYAEHLGSADTRTPLHDLIDAAVLENSVQVAKRLLDDSDWADHRSDVLSYGYRSVAVVPIAEGDHAESVLVIHAEDADIFDERERAVLGELGDAIGYALRNVERAEALRTDERTEIELEIGDERLFTNRITTEFDVDVEFVGAVTRDADTLQVFLRLTGPTADGLGDELQTFETVVSARPLSVEEGAGLYQLTVSIPPLVRALRTHGVRLRTLTAENGVSTLVAVLVGDADVRTVVEAVRTAYPDTELRARRAEAEPVDTRETFRDHVLDRLTEKQRDALRTAHYGGFYEWPRETTSEELAETRGIAASTFQYHLRAAERKVIDAVLA